MALEIASAFVHRIVLLGGESSGKTTLTAALADHFKTIWVHEYGRELREQQQGILSEEDLLKIGHEQIRRKEHALRSANGYLFCDTSPPHHLRLQPVDVRARRSSASEACNSNL